MTTRRISTPGILLLGAALLSGCATEPEFRLRRLAVDPAAGGDATLSPDGKRFVTTSRRAGHWDLWAFDIETSEWQQLTDHEADDFEARWSPDGRRLTFTSTRGGGKNVWVLNLEDGAMQQLTASDHEDEYPAWSPDGGSIVYTGGPWNHRDHFIVPAAGGPPRRVTRESGRAGACAFDPSGESLICHRYQLGTGDVFRLWVEDGEITPLTIGRSWDYKPTPSGDGEWIAFSRSEEGPSHIAVMPARGGRVLPLTDSPYDDRWPTWSSAGDTLLFHRVVDRGTGLHLLDRASGEVRVLVGEEEAPLQASLDPAGRRVVYCAQLPDRRVLRLLDLESGDLRTVDTGPGSACYPRWSPDGERIAYTARTGTGSEARWEVSIVRPDGSERMALTAGLGGLRGMDGPVDWSPDGRRIVFHADTEPFEANLYLIEVASRELTPLTQDGWFDEAPSFAPDGRSVLFMSTRGGDWTWGLFRMALDGDSAEVGTGAGGIETLETLAGPDWEEKNFPRQAADGSLLWSAYREDGIELLVARDAAGERQVLTAAGEGARWPSASRDGRLVLFTRVERHVEYWLAENLFGRGSPLLGLLDAQEAPRRGGQVAGETEGETSDEAPVEVGEASCPRPEYQLAAQGITPDGVPLPPLDRSPVHLKRR